MATLTVSASGVCSMAGYDSLNLRAATEILATIDTSTLVVGQSYLVTNLSAVRCGLALTSGGLLGPKNYIAKDGATRWTLPSVGAAGGLNSLASTATFTWDGANFTF